MYGWFYIPSSCFSYPGLLRKESCLRRITASLEPKMASHTLFSIISMKLDRKFQEKWWITIFLGFHFATFLEITTLTFPGDYRSQPRLKGAHCASRAQRGAPCCNHLRWWPRGHRWSRVQRIGLRENLNRKPWFLPSNIGFSCKFSHHPILWRVSSKTLWRSKSDFPH